MSENNGGGLVLFGVSNVLSDIFDCAMALSRPIKTIVMNQPEVLRDRTRSVHERVTCLHPRPIIQDLKEFKPRQGEEYFLGTTAEKRGDLANHLENEFGIHFCSLVHPTAYVSPLATVAGGVFVGAKSAIGAEVQIGSHVYINRGVTVGHDTVLGDYSRLNPGCDIAGHVTLGRGVTVGIGATIIEEVDIGDGALVAAGAVVTRDVAKRTLVAGVPATVKKTIAG